MNAKKPTRELWLVEAVGILAKLLFQPEGARLPAAVRVSVGFPFGRRKGGKGAHSIGQCWAHECSADGSTEIFISPELDDAADVLAVLAHELVHAALGVEEGHGKNFRRLALAIGLEGKMTATVAGEILTKKLKHVAGQLGRYPHRQLLPGQQDGPKKEGTRLLKIVCPECGWTARSTAKWIDAGLPTCVCGGQIAPA